MKKHMNWILFVIVFLSACGGEMSLADRYIDAVCTGFVNCPESEIWTGKKMNIEECKSDMKGRYENQSESCIECLEAETDYCSIALGTALVRCGCETTQGRFAQAFCDAGYACMKEKGEISTVPYDDCMEDLLKAYDGQGEKCIECIKAADPCDALGSETQKKCGCIK